MVKSRRHLIDICAVARLGALALNSKLTPEERSASARHAVTARWAATKKAKRKAWGEMLRKARARARRLRKRQAKQSDYMLSEVRKPARKR